MLNKTHFLLLIEEIYGRSGILIDEKKFSALAPKIEEIMRRHGFDAFHRFYEHLKIDKRKDAWQDILNLVTINETYFYREYYQMQTMVSHVLPRLHAHRTGHEPLRILSAPCSSGEESYSIALSLVDEKSMLEQRDFEIIGIDINSEAILRAKEGVFSPRSVKNVPNKLLQQYFKRSTENFEIVPFLKKAVSFKTLNVMDRSSMNALGKFDVIFSRNMLIYFDDHSRKQVTTTFYEMLKPKGTLFLGHAETMNKSTSMFRAQKNGNVIYYVKE